VVVKLEVVSETENAQARVSDCLVNFEDVIRNVRLAARTVKFDGIGANVDMDGVMSELLRRLKVLAAVNALGRRRMRNSSCIDVLF
jgi:hypothetical protein